MQCTSSASGESVVAVGCIVFGAAPWESLISGQGALYDWLELADRGEEMVVSH